MRIGKPVKKSRAWKRAGHARRSHTQNANPFPRHIAAETVVGQVSPDLTATLFAPRLKALAVESLERYANELLLYEDSLVATHQNESETTVGMDGSTLSSDDTVLIVDSKRSPPAAPLYHSQACLDRLDSLLTDVSEHFIISSGSSNSNAASGWKIHANAARFERSLDEKYGIFRPFIANHPEVEQFVRSVQRNYAMGYFSPLRSKPPIPRATAVILLVIMQRGGKCTWEVLVLAALFFLVGLQPWALVTLVCALQGLLVRRQRKAVGTMARKIRPVEPYYCNNNNPKSNRDNPDDTERIKRQKYDMLSTPVGQKISEDTTDSSIDTSNYDVILLGHGPGTLYAAALLSRAGRRVLVLSSLADASGCVNLTTTTTTSHTAWQNIPMDVEHSNISKIQRQQEILAPALASTTDCQGGVRFAKIGCPADGYAFEIVSVPGMGTDGGGDNNAIPFVLKASGGIHSFMEDAAMYLGDAWPPLDDTGSGDSRTGQYVAACESMNANASMFYLSKILPESVNKLRSNTTYHDATLRTCSTLLNSCFPLNVHLRSLMAAIGMKGENLPPSATSMAAHVTNVCATLNEEGMHYPVGGPRALAHALAHVVTQSGGRIVTDAIASELIFDDTIQTTAASKKSRSQQGTDPVPPCCVGVKLKVGQRDVVVRFSSDRYKMKPPHCPVVVSMEGFIHTFIRLLPDDIRTTFKVPRGLPVMSEQRPVVHFLIILQGTATDLNVTGADFYRLPGAAVAHDEVDSATGEVTYGTIGWSDDDLVESGEPDDSAISDLTVMPDEAMQDDSTRMNTQRRKKRRTAKFETGQSWIRIAFPSAKDPSFEERHGKVTTCVVTIEADDDFVVQWDTKPRIFMPKKATAATGGEIQRLSDRVKKDLCDLFPQLECTLAHFP